MKYQKPLALGAFALLTTLNAGAAPVVVEYTASIGNICAWQGDTCVGLASSAAPGFTIAVGEQVTGRFSYDDATRMTEDAWGYPYRGLLVGQFTQSLTFSSGATVSASYGHAIHMSDSDDYDHILTEGYDQPDLSGTYAILRNRFENVTQSGVARPYFLPTAGEWQNYSTSASTFEFISGVNVTGNITSFRVLSAVPEPATHAMLLAGLVPVLLRKRRTAQRKA